MGFLTTLSTANMHSIRGMIPTGGLGSTRIKTLVPFRPPEIHHGRKCKKNNFKLNATFFINLRQQEIRQVQ